MPGITSTVTKKPPIADMVRAYLDARLDVSVAAEALEMPTEALRRALDAPRAVAMISEAIEREFSRVDAHKFEWLAEVRNIALAPPTPVYDKRGAITGYDARDKLRALELLGKYLRLFADENSAPAMNANATAQATAVVVNFVSASNPPMRVVNE